MKRVIKFYSIISASILMLSIAAFAGNSQIFQESITGGTHHNNPVIYDSDGPDAYGYYYYDSEDIAFNAPEYNWIDISGYGTNMEINTEAVNVGPFPIGFTFNFYDVDYISFRASSNGFVSFGSTNIGNTNQSIPTSGEPNSMLAIFWDYLDPLDTGEAYYYTNNTDTLIVSYHNFQHHSESGEYSFQAIITADGNILYQYLSLTGTLDSHTIGIEDNSGSNGLEYVYNTSSDETGISILFSKTRPDYGEKDVLVVAAGNATTFLAELEAYSDINSVDFFNARYDTPDLNTLEQYDAVVVWTNYRLDDATALGDVLADYEDNGGAVTLLMFDFNSDWELEGRIMTEYSPFTISPDAYADRSLGDYDPGHYIMMGVNSLTEYYAVEVELQNDPVLVASYTDGTPLVAYNPENNLVALNVYVGDTRNNSGDVIDMVHNGIIFSTKGPAEILFVVADYGADLAEHDLMQMPGISGIHYYNGRDGVPSLDYLNMYDAVVVWPNYELEDSQQLGNRLADYVDMGGGVVLQQFCFTSNSIYNLQGRIMDSYSPFGGGDIYYGYHSLGWYNADHTLMQGVSEVTEYYASDVTIENGGVTVASYDNSTPFVAYNPDHDVVAINGYIGDDRDISGDIMTITYNALNLVRDMVDINEDEVALPEKFSLAQNYPNPFNANTIIRFNLPQQSNVVLDIYNIIGQRVASIDKGEMAAGSHFIRYDASKISSGVYFYKLTAGDLVETRKMTLVK